MDTALLPSQSAPALTLQLHTCDRCGAQGKVRVVLPSGLDLVFCGHHAAAYADVVPAIALDTL